MGGEERHEKNSENDDGDGCEYLAWALCGTHLAVDRARRCIVMAPAAACRRAGADARLKFASIIPELCVSDTRAPSVGDRRVWGYRSVGITYCKLERLLCAKSPNHPQISTAAVRRPRIHAPLPTAPRTRLIHSSAAASSPCRHPSLHLCLPPHALLHLLLLVHRHDRRRRAPASAAADGPACWRSPPAARPDCARTAPNAG